MIKRLCYIILILIPLGYFFQKSFQPERVAPPESVMQERPEIAPLLKTEPKTTVVVAPSPEPMEITILTEPKNTEVNHNKIKRLRENSSIKWEDFLSVEHNDAEIKQFLKEQKLSNPTQIIDNSRIDPRPDPHLAGCFKGEINLPNGENWQLSMMHSLDDPGSSNHGTYSILLRTPQSKTADGRAGREITRGIRSSAGLPGQIIIEVSPEDSIQLFYWQINDIFIGNYYRKLGASQYGYMGPVKLHRAEGCK